MNKSNRFKAIFYALALLLFGGVIGAMVKSAASANPQTLRLGREDEIAALIRDRLTAKLELTKEQQASFEPMIKKAAHEMEASHRDCLIRVLQASDNLHSQIEPGLMPEQRQKLLELEKERADRMWEKYRYRPPGTNASLH